VVFVCGPQKFRFFSFRPWFDDDGFPWGIDTADGGSAWLTDPIQAAVNAVYDDSDDTGAKFWNGYHQVQAALKADLQAYCGH
jgi:hypothetical protein